VPLLLSAGHTVVGLTRSPAKADAIRRAGAAAAIADALNRAAAIVEAVVVAQPDVIVHEMTSLSGANDLRRFDRSFSLTNRLRTEGLQNLLAAAKQAGTPRIVVQSFCGPYARIGGPVKSEEDPLDPEPPRKLRRTLQAIRYLESAVTSSPNIKGVVLRYGAFYGPWTGLLDGPMIDRLRRRRVPLIGDANGWWSLLHIDDAAAATATAVERGAPGIYNIVDDEPAPVRDWLPALAALLGPRPPRHIPKSLARIAAGEHIVTMMTEARAGSNAKAKPDLAWQPAHSSWRRGFAAVLSQCE
jgi:nucleoside-diphosphate-sugar epimerase